MARVRLGALVVAAALLAAPSAQAARSALFFFFFDRTAATPGERVTLRLAGTPTTFRTSQRVRPLRPPMRLYLVPNAAAEKVQSRFDPRLHFVGSLRPDKNGRGVLSFTVPPLESGSYAAAVWCPACARSSRGRTFFVLDPRRSRYRSQMLLRVAAPPTSADSCPVTHPNGNRPLAGLPARHGNGLLWTGLPRDGTVVIDPDRADADGSVFWTKLIWIATRVSGDLKVEVRRLDTPGSVLRPEVVSGHLSGWSGRSWAARMRFAGEGCWKVGGRVDDVSLSFVVKVLLRRGA